MENRDDFDALARELAQGLSRREALRRVCGGFAGAVLASLGAGRAWGAPNPCAAYCNTLPKPQRSNCQNACKQCNGNTQNLCPSLTTNQVACCTQGASCCAGACCSAGSGCCGNACTPLATNQNCTKCGDACTGGTLCVSATAGCQCPSGSAFCQGGTTCCPSDQTCCAGVCCAAGLGCSGTGCCHPTLSILDPTANPSTFCCSGNVRIGESGSLSGEYYCCANNGTTCNLDTDCCENTCGDNGKCCGEALPTGGGSCTADSDCCSGIGFCQNGSCVCIAGGGACTSSSQCCTRSCTNGQCDCMGLGNTCSADYVCCSPAVCRTFSSATDPDDTFNECCLPENNACASDSDCCSRMCQSGTCACVAVGGACIFDNQCCGAAFCDLVSGKCV